MINIVKLMSALLCVALCTTVFVVATPENSIMANDEVNMTEGTSIENPLYTQSIEEDLSFPMYGEYDYGLNDGDIRVIHPDPDICNEYVIEADIHNYALTSITMLHANPADSYNGEWVEYDFYQPASEIVDITVRATDTYCPGTHVDVNVFLDGKSGLVGSFDMNENPNWQLLASHDVPVSEGWHVLRVTLVYGEIPRDLSMDWIDVGDLRIEAETFDRTGGTGAPRYNGVDDISPRDVVVQFYDGNPTSGGVLIGERIPGEINTMNDAIVSPYHFDVHYIENNGVGTVSVDWTATLGVHDIYVLVDPGNVYPEINEVNNVAVKNLEYKCLLLGADDVVPEIDITSPTTGDPTYEQSGTPFTVEYTYIEENPISVTVFIMDGYIPLTTQTFTDGWSGGIGACEVDIPADLPEGIYNVMAEMTDMSLNSWFDIEVNALIIDNTPPVVDITAPTTEIPAYASAGDDLTIEYTYVELYVERVEIFIYDFINSPGNPVVASYVFTTGWSEGTGSNVITLPTDIPPGIYTISMNMYDYAGNTGVTSFDMELNSLIVT